MDPFGLSADCLSALPRYNDSSLLAKLVSFSLEPREACWPNIPRNPRSSSLDRCDRAESDAPEDLERSNENERGATSNSRRAKIGNVGMHIPTRAKAGSSMDHIVVSAVSSVNSGQHVVLSQR